jgi:tetratricopeptide (TPR) repeat protein
MIVATTVLAVAVSLGGAHSSEMNLCCTAEMAKAETLQEVGRNRAAHRQYIRVARAQAAAGEFSGDALWNAAAVSLHLGNRRRAAQELDTAARVAAEFGRTNLQVRANLEAAFLYHELGRGDLALARIARVDALVTAPEVSDEIRSLVDRRIERS